MIAVTGTNHTCPMQAMAQPMQEPLLPNRKTALHLRPTSHAKSGRPSHKCCPPSSRHSAFLQNQPKHGDKIVTKASKASSDNSSNGGIPSWMTYWDDTEMTYWDDTEEGIQESRQQRQLKTGADPSSSSMTDYCMALDSISGGDGRGSSSHGSSGSSMFDTGGARVRLPTILPLTESEKEAIQHASITFMPHGLKRDRKRVEPLTVDFKDISISAYTADEAASRKYRTQEWLQKRAALGDASTGRRAIHTWPVMFAVDLDPEDGAGYDYDPRSRRMVKRKKQAWLDVPTWNDGLPLTPTQLGSYHAQQKEYEMPPITPEVYDQYRALHKYLEQTPTYRKLTTPPRNMIAIGSIVRKVLLATAWQPTPKQPQGGWHRLDPAACPTEGRVAAQLLQRVELLDSGRPGQSARGGYSSGATAGSSLSPGSGGSRSGPMNSNSSPAAAGQRLLSVRVLQLLLGCLDDLPAAAAADDNGIAELDSAASKLQLTLWKLLPQGGSETVRSFQLRTAMVEPHGNTAKQMTQQVCDLLWQQLFACEAAGEGRSRCQALDTVDRILSEVAVATTAAVALRNGCSMDLYGQVVRLSKFLDGGLAFVLDDEPCFGGMKQLQDDLACFLDLPNEEWTDGLQTQLQPALQRALATGGFTGLLSTTSG